jgi:AmmeMemoRadiSam system protein B
MAARAPAVAGSFYPASPSALTDVVDRMLAAVRVDDAAPVPKALVVPHAGYVYSGPIAASAYARLRPAADRITRAVIVGPAHRVWVDGVVDAGADAFVTPLGSIAVDVDAITALGKNGSIATNAQAHAREHSLEVQLPFVQRVLPRAKIVPLAVGHTSPEVVGRALESLWGGDETVVLVSSDLSHYHPYDVGRALDAQTAERIVALDATEIPGERACGCAGINGLVWVARRRGLRAELLDLRSSGDTAGSKDEVVGYGAFAFHENARVPARGVA